MLTFRKLSKRSDNHVIFPPIDLTINNKDIVALYSSVNIREHLLRLLTLQTTPSDGAIYLDDQALSKANKEEIQCYYLQDVMYDYLTVSEMLQFINRMQIKEASIDTLLQFVSLQEKRKDKLARLTFSERKRVQLACLLLQDASVYIFEEVDQNVDLETKQIMIKVVNELASKGKSICLLTTNMESALTFADKVYRLNEKGIHEVEVEEDELQERKKDEVTPLSLEKIPSKVDDKIVLFDPYEIDYIESHEGVSYLYINEDKFPSLSTLQDLEAQLLPFGFFRCHRSYIVNLQKVREVITWTRNSYSLVLDDKSRTTIPLSKAKMAILKEMLGI
ncbi:MAG TPA: LytTR family transcriptional regulator DNA-binding domain-containing protein [Pseudogracilibacillus sp.]|nr:LytTR family transcriptional regulator DNA-binding domain-containing protein [Pseudogracilibacillus sp.]